MSSGLSWPEPHCEPVGPVSYSEWARIRTCNLRAAFARDAGTKHWLRGTTWSAVGNARHHLAEEVQAGRATGLPPPSSAWVRARMDALLSGERDRLVQEWAPALVPPVHQWPDTVYVKARLARDLGTGGGSGWPDPKLPAQGADDENSAGPAAKDAGHPSLGPGETLVELWVEDVPRQLRGRLDRLENRHGRLAVIDLKSGIGSTPSDPVTRFRDQMLFYAGLVQAAYGEWPELELQPMTGPSVPVTYSPTEAKAMRRAVADDRDAFNAAVAAHALVNASTPSLRACSWCPFQVVCPALSSNWEKVTPERQEAPVKGFSLAAGIVQTVRHTPDTTDVVIAQDRDLSTPAGEVSVTRLPAELSVRSGDALAVAGAEVSGGSGVLRARWDTRIRVEHLP